MPRLGSLLGWVALAVTPALAQDAPRSGGTAAYQSLHWRCAGPLRGGWATAVTGVRGQPSTFYFGAAAGGVWKSDDAGRTWQPLFQRERASSVGALEVAPSDPAIVYVGTGQVTTRWDIAEGDGLWRSADGGATWEPRGLAETRHIGRLWVDPRDADVVLVAALGHLFGPNGERGVFKTTDGGRSWRRVLFVDEDTGAVDLAADPEAPDVVYAATWSARRFPWQAYFTPMVGPGSALWSSRDGGENWTRLSGHGLPEVPLGRIGLAVAPGSQGQRVWATIAAGDAGGLFRSDDGGGTWSRTSGDTALANPYFSALTPHPAHPDTLYVMGRSMSESTDGGRTFRYTRGSPGGDDYHMLWIDPDAPERRITGSDQGAVVTLNGGRTWSSWYNQPTGQFYRVATDDRFPYWIYSGQQDSGTVAQASRSDYGQLTLRDWLPVGGDERDGNVPFPGDPSLVFGAGLGGKVTRWDARTGQVAVVSPWPVSSYGARPSSVRYRSSWITPLAISKVPPHALYSAAQVLFRSLDQGETWSVVSPDLTGAANGAQACEGDVDVRAATACGYGVIFAIAPSPLDANVVWVGTDNGRVGVSRDGCASWNVVTPPGLEDWSKVAQIDASPIDAASAYVAVDRHRLDDRRPYVWVTHDFGASWREAGSGLPQDGWVNVVRQDPQRAGLLYAGTSRGAHVSFDDGVTWRSLQLDLPTTAINDLTVHEDDVVVATHGRGLWVLDDVGPLRQLDLAVAGAPVHLFAPARALRLSPNQNRDTPLPADEPRGENPPAGAVIDYVLQSEPSAPIELAFLDGEGTVVRRFVSGAREPRPAAPVYFPEEWLGDDEGLPASAGHNRFVWNLRLPRPRAIDYEYAMAAVPGADTPALPQGLFVRPGRYTVRLTVDGKRYERALEVAVDPRARVDLSDLRLQFEFYAAIVEPLEALTQAHEELDRFERRTRERLREAGASAPGDGREGAANEGGEPGAAGDLRRAAQALEAYRKAPPDEQLEAVAAGLGALATDVESADARPTAPQRELFDSLSARARRALERWQALRREQGFEDGEPLERGP